MIDTTLLWTAVFIAMLAAFAGYFVITGSLSSSTRR